MIIKAGKEYEVKCTLGTIKDIESRFNKPFYTLLSDVNKMTTTEQVRFLYVGVKRADPQVEEKEFAADCEDNLGLGMLSEYIEQYILELQYPGMSKEEIQKKLEKKLQQAEAMKAFAGIK